MEKSVNPQSSSILIVGAGPVGMTAALELSRLQIPIRIIDKMAEPATTSRAVVVHARTLELFEQRGMIQSMLKIGNQGLATNVYCEGKRTFRLELSHNSSEYGYILVISQADTEAILRTALEKQGVKIEREVEFVAFSQSDRHRGDAVKAILKHRDGKLEDFHCAYLIDTEGSHSVCRATVDLQFKGKTHDGSFASGDLYIEGELADTDFHIFSAEASFLGLYPLGDRRFRVIASNPPSGPSEDHAPSIEELQKFYDQRSHIPARFHDMNWGSCFRINSRMVDRLKVGRAFFGGDSAHVHSPAGGQGMNTGIQDMINLAWKLAFVLKGQAHPKLLDTYTQDRIPVIEDVLTKTETLGNTVGTTDKILRWVLINIASWFVRTTVFQKSTSDVLSEVAVNYRNSPLSVSHGRSWGRALIAGNRIPNVTVLTSGREGEDTDESKSEPKKLFHVLSTDRFTLLFANLTDADATHQSVQSSLSIWKPVMQTIYVAPAPGLEQPFRSIFGSQSSLILVRPDGYAAFVGAEHSVEALAKYLNSWFPKQQQTK